MKAKLVTYTDSLPDLSFVLAGAEMHIGRDSDNDIQLPHPKVSRRHASLTRSGDIWTIVDCSRNGVSINHEKVESHTLVEGDCVGIGPFELYYLSDASDDAVMPSYTIDVSRRAGQHTIDTLHPE